MVETNTTAENLLSADQKISLCNFNSPVLNTMSIGRRGLERLDLLLLAVESLDLNGSEAMLLTSAKLGLNNLFPNRVELWKCRSYNPMRRATRRGTPSTEEIEALLSLLCAMADRIYPLLRQLLSNREPKIQNQKKWDLFNDRFNDLIQERMNPRRGSVRKLLSKENFQPFHRNLILTLALCSGPGGVNRLRANLLDPSN